MPENKKTTINARKYDGSIHRSWEADLVETNGSLLVFKGVFVEPVVHKDLGNIKKGTVSHEFYWLDRWYNVFRFHEPDGAFRNFYCNINMPPSLQKGILDYIDLDIDMIVNKNLEITMLDESEFVENKIRFGYSTEVSEKALATVDELRSLIRSARFPFDYP